MGDADFNFSSIKIIIILALVITIKIYFYYLINNTFLYPNHPITQSIQKKKRQLNCNTTV